MDPRRSKTSAAALDRRSTAGAFAGSSMTILVNASAAAARVATTVTDNRSPLNSCKRASTKGPTCAPSSDRAEK